MSMDLAGRRVLLLGASGGIGAATARRLMAAGARVTAVGRRADRLQSLGAGCVAAAGDLDDPAFRTALLREPHDDLVSAVGIAVPEPLAQADPANWERMFRTNVLSVMALAVPMAKEMAGRGGGTLLFVGSVLARRVAPNVAAYAASKHALRAFVGGLRAEFGPAGVRVVEVAPGYVGDTEFHRHADHPALAGQFSDRPYTPISSTNVAEAVHFALALPPTAEVTLLELRPRGQFVPA